MRGADGAADKISVISNFKAGDAKADGILCIPLDNILPADFFAVTLDLRLQGFSETLVNRVDLVLFTDLWNRLPLKRVVFWHQHCHGLLNILVAKIDSDLAILLAGH